MPAELIDRIWVTLEFFFLWGLFGILLLVSFNIILMGIMAWWKR